MSAGSEFYSFSRNVNVRGSMHRLEGRVKIDYTHIRKDEVVGLIWLRLASNGGIL